MTEQRLYNPNLIIPVGTQIVTRVEVKGFGGGSVYPPGAVGVVMQAPTDNAHAYRVRLPDGAEATLHRHAFAVRKHIQQDGLAATDAVLADFALHHYVIYRCVVGSRAYRAAGGCASSLTLSCS